MNIIDVKSMLELNSFKLHNNFTIDFDVSFRDGFIVSTHADWQNQIMQNNRFQGQENFRVVFQDKDQTQTMHPY